MFATVISTFFFATDWVALQLGPPLRKRCYYELRRSAGWRRMSGSSTRAHEYDLKDRAAEKLTSKVMPYLTVSGAEVIAVKKKGGRNSATPCSSIASKRDPKTFPRILKMHDLPCPQLTI
jgi:hypothetical protein